MEVTGEFSGESAVNEEGVSKTEFLGLEVFLKLEYVN